LLPVAATPATNFAASFASVVDTAPVANLPPVSMIPAANLLPVSTASVANCHRYHENFSYPLFDLILFSGYNKMLPRTSKEKKIYLISSTIYYFKSQGHFKKIKIDLQTEIKISLTISADMSAKA
jgi:hypothetical protein